MLPDLTIYLNGLQGFQLTLAHVFRNPETDRDGMSIVVPRIPLGGTLKLPCPLFSVAFKGVKSVLHDFLESFLLLMCGPTIYAPDRWSNPDQGKRRMMARYRLLAIQVPSRLALRL